MVPEPQDPKPLRLQPLVPSPIRGVLQMLTTVHLDHQPTAHAGEVHYEVAQRNLPAKLCPQEAAAQATPEESLGLGHLPPKLAGQIGEVDMIQGAYDIALLRLRLLPQALQQRPTFRV